MNRYSRQLLLPVFRAEHQEIIRKMTIGVCGIGGLGTIASMYLVGAGFGTVILVDPDTVELHNLHRQVLYREDNIGQNKAEVAAKSLYSLNSECKVQFHIARIEQLSNEVFCSADLWLDCLDDLATERYLLDLCIANNKPFIYGSVSEWSGMLAVCKSGESKNALKAILAKTEAPKGVRGILGPVAGAIASMQVTEAIKTLCGFEETLEAKMFTANYLKNEFNTFSIV